MSASGEPQQRPFRAEQAASPPLAHPVAGDPAAARDTSRDGLRNRLESFVLTGFRPFWSFVNGQPWLSRTVNRLLVDNAVLKAPVRPLGRSTMADYASWPSLTDRSYFARYLPPRAIPDLPPPADMARLYMVKSKGPRLSDRSSLLFPCFAQWFTDGFLMTWPDDPNRTQSNHQIDLSQVYGLTDAVTSALRLKDETAGRRGRLLVETEGGEDWAPRLYDPVGVRRPEFAAVPDPLKLPAGLPPDQKAAIFAFGGERANATVFTAAINTLFLREHNRLSRAIETANPSWDDERVFQTARNVNIVQLINVVVGEYINHISPYWFKLLADPTPAYTARWNRENWIPAEFNLLYRWHSLIPERARWRDADIAMADTRFDNRPMLRDGLGVALAAASQSPAWQVGLFNTAEMLRDVEIRSLMEGRARRLASYNDYREAMRYPRVTRFEQISGDPDVVAALRTLYGDVDRVEFFVGLFAEDPPPRSAVPPLIGRMVAVDAFSHALSNPLLSPHVYGAQTFTRRGMDSIAATSTLSDLAARNLAGGLANLRITMDAPGYESVATS